MKDKECMVLCDLKNGTPQKGVPKKPEKGSAPIGCNSLASLWKKPKQGNRSHKPIQVKRKETPYENDHGCLLGGEQGPKKHKGKDFHTAAAPWGHKGQRQGPKKRLKGNQRKEVDFGSEGMHQKGKDAEPAHALPQ